ncbi:MAG: hypothetical protein ACSW8B_01905 [bacterium]
MLDQKNLVALAKAVVNANPSAPTAYSWNGESLSYSALNETLRQELNELGGSYDAYRQNKNRIFSLIEQVLDDILPKKVAINYAQFAETKVFAQGDKPIFRRKLSSVSRARAKQFITRVGLAGVYEVFKLGRNEEVFEVRTSAIGGAAQVGIEEFLDGRVDFQELIDIVYEGMDELIYKEIAHAMRGAIAQLPAVNRVAANGFDEAAFDQLLMVASAYGEPTIYCTEEFAVKLLPNEAWRYTEAMKDELWRNGHFQRYKKWNVVILQNGFEDASNTTKVIDPGFCWIIPSGADMKPVKVAFEGNTLVDERPNYDWSKEIQVYRKVGVVCMMTNDICAYVDTSLLGQMDEWFLDGVNGTIITYDGRYSGTGCLVPCDEEDDGKKDKDKDEKDDENKG